MSLDAQEIAVTRDELAANLALSGLTRAEVAADLRLSPARLDSTVAVDDADPADVWLLRDYLEQAVRDAGRSPVPFTVLTPRSRRLARAWFTLRDAPRHAFTGAAPRTAQA